MECVSADHELVGTIDDTDGPEFTIDLENERTMMLRKVRAVNLRCPEPFNVHTGTIDGTAVYSALPGYELTLRERRPLTCRLREGEPGFLPLTTSADEEGRFFIVAGDGRVDEHAVLTTMHTVRACHTCLHTPSLTHRPLGCTACINEQVSQITVLLHCFFKHTAGSKPEIVCSCCLGSTTASVTSSQKTPG